MFTVARRFAPRSASPVHNQVKLRAHSQTRRQSVETQPVRVLEEHTVLEAGVEPAGGGSGAVHEAVNVSVAVGLALDLVRVVL